MTAAEFKAIRTALGLTQSEWASWLGLTRTFVTDIERGRPGSTVSVTVARLAMAFRDGWRLP